MNSGITVGWYRNSLGKRVEVVAVEEIMATVDTDITVVVYRFEGRKTFHVRTGDSLGGWTVDYGDPSKGVIE